MQASGGESHKSESNILNPGPKTPCSFSVSYLVSPLFSSLRTPLLSSWPIPDPHHSALSLILAQAQVRGLRFLISTGKLINTKGRKSKENSRSKTVLIKLEIINCITDYFFVCFIEPILPKS